MSRGYLGEGGYGFAELLHLYARETTRGMRGCETTSWYQSPLLYSYSQGGSMILKIV